MLIEGKISRMKTGTAHLKTKSVNQRDCFHPPSAIKKDCPFLNNPENLFEIPLIRG